MKKDSAKNFTAYIIIGILVLIIAHDLYQNNMENVPVYIIIGIFGLGIVLQLYQKNKQNRTPYFNIKKRLDDDLSKATFSDDWQKRQKINLQILWLETIKEVDSRDFFLKKKEDDEVQSILARLSEDKIKFPNKWKLNDLYHAPFAQGIISDYGKVLVENGDDLYKPESILPYPKRIIKKAIYFTLDYLNYDKPLYEIPDKKKLADNLNGVKAFLTFFVDTTNAYLPKDGFENAMVGQKLREQQPDKQEDDLLLIDWRSESDWIAAALRYGDGNEFDSALKCIERVKNINPNSKNLKGAEGLLYQYMSEYYEKYKDTDLAKEYMKKAADLDNEDAKKIVKEKYSN